MRREWQVADIVQLRCPPTKFGTLRHLPKHGIIYRVIRARGRDQFGDIRTLYEILWGEQGLLEHLGADLVNITHIEWRKKHDESW